MTIGRCTSLNDYYSTHMISDFRILCQALDIWDFLVERADLVGSVTAGVLNFLNLAVSVDRQSRLKGLYDHSLAEM